MKIAGPCYSAIDLQEEGMSAILQPLPDASTFKGADLQIDFRDDGRSFSCFHCGNLPKRGDVLLVRMQSGRTMVMIAQEMKERSRVFTDTGLRFGEAHPVGYLEDIAFELPPKAKMGFIVG